MALLKRDIDLTFQLGEGSFGTKSFNTVKVTGLRVRVEISEAGGPMMGQANIDVFGMDLSMMQKLSTIQRVGKGMPFTRWNRVLVAAGDETNGMSTIFQGNMVNSVINTLDAPSVSLKINAIAGAFESVEVVPPSSYPGGAQVAVIMQNLATKMGYAFENNGVTTVLAHPYYSGSLMQQMQDCARDAFIEAKITNGKLAIWPKGGSRESVIPVVSPATGMVGYPTNYLLGVAARTIFTPSLINGGQVKVESSLQFANGIYNIYQIGHDLESETPGGSWFSSFIGQPYNVA